MLSSSNTTSHGSKILRINIESNSHKTSHQVPLENGQFMKTKPASVMTGDFATPCGEFTKSKNQEDAQLIRTEPKSSIGPILSVCWSESESLYGMNILVLSVVDRKIDCGSPLACARSASASNRVLLVQRSRTKQSESQPIPPPAITQGGHLCLKQGLTMRSSVFKTHDR